MIALFGLLIIISISIIVVRIGAIALELTGLSSEIATFQAQSAFSGVGFTTAESEVIVNHPVRRKIIRILILLGSVGITSSIATLILTFVGQSRESALLRGIILVLGLVVIYIFARSKIVYNLMKRVIIKSLGRWTTLRIFDYEQILGLSRGYSICRIVVKEESWLSNRKLKDLKLNLEGILVLAIFRKIDDEEKVMGAPKGDTEILAGDVLMCYGREEALKNLAQRIKGYEGDKAHEKEIEKEQQLEKVREMKGGFD
ncbi:MAG: potassium transporter TrkA [Candidatus Omnitrophota bacterium]|nr:MAG: potassium transporter TrkA [Candidatus Omnitrophota bacterium]